MIKTAMVFPGQGSQSVAMLADLAKHYAIVQQTFDQASTAIDIDLWQLCQQGPAEKLNQTEFTQPALLAAGVAVWRIWQQQNGVVPEYLAGHSLGEYTALVCAQALTFEEAVLLVYKRGQYMQSAVPIGTGAMAALLGLSDAQVISICQQANTEGVVSAANFNSPGQVVIAGQVDAVERAIELAKSEGAKRALRLPVSVPSHCQLMVAAAENLKQEMQSVTFVTPAIPVINNVDVTEYSSAESIRDGLIRQLYSPVRWVEVIQRMSALKIECVLELGPGKVLTGLNKRINNTINCLSVNDEQSLLAALNKEV